jgi:hypothetical protein
MIQGKNIDIDSLIVEKNESDNHAGYNVTNKRPQGPPSDRGFLINLTK